jgi:hypothetical protein
VVRRFPTPIRVLVGDLSDSDRLLIGLELRSPGASPGDRIDTGTGGEDLDQPKNGVTGESHREDDADLAEVRWFVPR